MRHPSRLVRVHPHDRGAPRELAPRALLEQLQRVRGQNPRRRRVEPPSLEVAVLQPGELLGPAVLILISIIRCSHATELSLGRLQTCACACDRSGALAEAAAAASFRRSAGRSETKRATSVVRTPAFLPTLSCSPRVDGGCGDPERRVELEAQEPPPARDVEHAGFGAEPLAAEGGEEPLAEELRTEGLVLAVLLGAGGGGQREG